MDNAGVSAEWDDIVRDSNALTETTITCNEKGLAVRSNAVGGPGLRARRRSSFRQPAPRAFLQEPFLQPHEGWIVR